jgi:3-oxoacyl-[acyl-carrier-protein] synthase II
MIISAACASASTAVARAAIMISAGRADCVLVIACDGITEFVFSGFSSLMALDRTASRPFDKGRSGLSLGEAAAYALIMSRNRALKEKREIVAEISGWGLSDDANHMTGPSRTSDGMIMALERALNSAGCHAEDISFISAHGTGTVYNDQMEMRAYRSVFAKEPVPVYSIKGALGHTLGAAGLVETIIAAKALSERRVPPTVNLIDVDDDAIGWASPDSQDIRKGRKALITNAGFSGINAALVLS